MPEKSIKRWLQELDAGELASDDGPIFKAVAALAEALKRCIPEGTDGVLRTLCLARTLLRGTKYEEE